MQRLARVVTTGLAIVASPALARAEGACTESVPPGATKPTLTENVPAHATAGELVKAEILVRHGAGETATLPADLPRLLGGDVRIADDGSWGKGALPKTSPDPADPSRATTLLEIPFVVLSTSLPRKTFTIPPVRVVVLRKGGGDLSVCTAAHEIAIDQPTANDPDPTPRPNPPTVPQRTVDEHAKAMAMAIASAVLATLAFVLLFLWWRRRPKPALPPPPPVPSWTRAIEAIAAARREYRAGGLAAKAYYDRLSDAVRLHLGETFGFDGLEQTTDEILARLRRIPSPSLPYDDVARLLGECDLVKFAAVSTSTEEGEGAAELAERVVRMTAWSSNVPSRPFDAPRELAERTGS